MNRNLNMSEPIENAFAKCVEGLLSVVIKDLSIQLGFVNVVELNCN